MLELEMELNGTVNNISVISKKVREKSRECHNHKPQPFPDIKKVREKSRECHQVPSRSFRRISLSKELLRSFSEINFVK